MTTLGNPQRDANRVFGSWSAENGIICDRRSRFDGMREGIAELISDGRLTAQTFRELLVREEYDKRYPNLPEQLEQK